jgi:hypothetical protein
MKSYKKRYRREKKRTLNLIRKCYALETQIEALIATYMKHEDLRLALKNDDWIDVERKVQAQK